MTEEISVTSLDANRTISDDVDRIPDPPDDSGTCLCSCTCSRRCVRKWLTKPSRPNFGRWDVTTWCLSFFGYLGGFGSSLWKLYGYGTRSEWEFLAVYLTSMIVPHVLVHLLSYWWFITDYRDQVQAWDGPAEHQGCGGGTFGEDQVEDTGESSTGHGRQAQVRDGTAADPGSGGQATSEAHAGETGQGPAGSVPVSIQVLHWLQCGVLLRMLRLFRLGWKTRETPSGASFHRYYLEQCDTSLIRLILVYCGSGPQLLVGLYTTHTAQTWLSWPLTFTAFAVFSLASNVSTYCSATRRHRPDKLELSRASVATQVIYRICFLVSRIVALLALLLLDYRAALGVLAAWWLVAFVCYQIWPADFSETPCQERLYSAVIAFVLLFGYLDQYDTPTRWRYAAYYSLAFVTQTTALVVYGVLHGSWAMLAVSVASFVLGLLLQLADARLLHPNGRWYMRREREPDEPRCAQCEQQRLLDAQMDSAEQRYYTAAA